MKLRKEEFRGTGQVFRFTLRQLVKSRANLISAIIMLLFALFSIPAATFFNDNFADDSSVLSTIYYLNETGCDVDFEKLSGVEPRFGNVLTAPSAFDLENWEQELKEDEAFVHMQEDEENGGFLIRVFCQDGDACGEMEVLSGAARKLFQSARYQKLGVTQEQIDQLTGIPVVNVDTVENYQEMPAVGADTFFAVQYVYAILVLILCTFSTTFIVRAIIEEKASRLVETLLVSVRPLAMILGKILAVMTYVFGLILMMIAGALLSHKMTGIFMGSSMVDHMIADMGLTADMLHFGPFTVVVVLISLLLGYFTFSIIGGIAGTGCSSMEDVESANMNVLLFVLGGYMVSCFTAAFSSAVGLIMSFIPFASIFCAPVQYVLGNISFPLLCMAWLVQLLLIVLLAWFCGSIYGDLIMYRGSKLKLGRMISMAREKKKGGM